ncbi:type I-E CRISPR-associated protein Cas5/CasD [Methylosinus sp. LW4]|uniref:type I-E CRISPR-associated protein Cas5/CasD n=1 Tax=Methylosinus sp. LW4 TaxID=136993 RepID=UPI0003674292|nr:type I-E CRISPR-associated protein Cas5/CasD [Methylosinus sp. LW4]
MRKLLLFQLVAPLGSFGDVAVGERRETGARPSHSALAGLLGAALGLERADPRQAEFAAALAFASRRDRLGPLIVDYHTTQTPPTRKGTTWATRREELAGKRNTILSRRDYRADCAFLIACGALEQSLFTLESLEQALRKPVFTLYLGRKSCPLGLPPDPLLVEAETLVDALAEYDRRRRRPDAYAHYFERDGEIALDDYFTGFPNNATCVETRRDVVLDRKLWRFDLRDEHVVTSWGKVPR